MENHNGQLNYSPEFIVADGDLKHFAMTNTNNSGPKIKELLKIFEDESGKKVRFEILNSKSNSDE